MTRTLIKVTLSPDALARVEAARSALALPGLPPLSRSEAVAVLVERGLAVTEGPRAPAALPSGWEVAEIGGAVFWRREVANGFSLRVRSDLDDIYFCWDAVNGSTDKWLPGVGGFVTAIDAMRAADAAWVRAREVERG